jgi:hypothetical protein
MGSPKNPAEKPDAARLNASVADFVTRLHADFPAKFARRPVAFPRDVLRRLDRAFFSQRRAPGRPRKDRVDAAYELLQKQRQEIKNGRRRPVDWPEIACAVLPGFKKSKDSLSRRMQLATLRNSVRMRERRACDGRNPTPRKSFCRAKHKFRWNLSR